MTSRWRFHLFAPLLGFAFLGACTAPPLGGEDVADSEGAASSGRQRVNLQYEGTCEFLRTCSRFSRNLPEGQVTWGCEGRGACDDDALWVAGPTRSQCGKTVRICRGSRCTNALVKDVSVSRSWEASNGVLSALGLPFGLTGRCSGYGGGQVTVEVQSGGSQAGEPSTPRAGRARPDLLERRLGDAASERHGQHVVGRDEGHVSRQRRPEGPRRGRRLHARDRGIRAGPRLRVGDRRDLVPVQPRSVVPRRRRQGGSVRGVLGGVLSCAHFTSRAFAQSA